MRFMVGGFGTGLLRPWPRASIATIAAPSIFGDRGNCRPNPARSPKNPAHADRPVDDRHWSQATAADLRRFLAQQMESQIERKLINFPVSKPLNHMSTTIPTFQESFSS